MPTNQAVLRVAIKTPLYHLFDYLPPADASLGARPGVRVRVPFGRGEAVGIVVETGADSTVTRDKLRRVSQILDDEPVLDDTLLALLGWAAAYYHQPPGEVYAAALPGLLRGGRQRLATTTFWSLSAAGRDCDRETLRRRAPRQAAAMTCLAGQTGGADADTLGRELGEGWRPVMRTLEKHGWVRKEQRRRPGATLAGRAIETGHELTGDQHAAVGAVRASLGRFEAFLLNGVTGSGKTEVYLQIIEAVIAAGRQSLVLVPEIGLTPQLVDRFSRRLATPISVLHSSLTDSERLAAWRSAYDGSAGVIVGTRSAVFAPMRSPGLIVVDEEHDTSYKQQEGFRYSARDLAVMRARRHGIPVLLGSATPSLESLHNVARKRYRQLGLADRPGDATLPEMKLVDIRREPLDGGLSVSLIGAMRSHLKASGQVLLFLNRRGFAPAWFCPGCGWTAPCRRCDARMTLHRSSGRLRCHHCGAQRTPESDCPECETPLQPVGVGTERIEETIARLFPDETIARIDRDSTRRRGSLEALLGEIHSGQRRILIGTQMLTKGHHFPDVSLVGIVDADQGLFGTDPRSSERLAQLIVQVAGRAGRAGRPGIVMIQTQCPEHPMLNTLITHGYPGFAEAALGEREAAGWPPFCAMALLRAESTDDTLPERFLVRARSLAGSPEGIEILGPAPAPMPRRAGRFRAQLLLQGPRGSLQPFLTSWAPRLGQLEGARRVRWSLDVDPIELF